MARTRSAKRTIHNSVEDIRDHAVGVGGNVRDIGEAVKDVLIEKLTDLLKNSVSFGTRTKDAARDAAQEARENLEERIQAQPYKAVLIAAGIGLLLGMALKRN
jgi:ElaB/YqjD/DUF883 family membrane-anchored ribosome-binding protein